MRKAEKQINQCFPQEKKIPQFLPFDHQSQYIKTDQNYDKKRFIFIILSLISAPGSQSWATLFGSFAGSSAFPQTFMDNIKNCQVITHEHDETLKTPNYRVHINSCRLPALYSFARVPSCLYPWL